jgi:hypothetical protein
MTDFALTSSLDAIRHLGEEGSTYGSARDVEHVLDDSGWQRFRAVIAKATIAYEPCDRSQLSVCSNARKAMTTGHGRPQHAELARSCRSPPSHG